MVAGSNALTRGPSLADRVTSELRTAILSGNMAAGLQLPAEQEIARDYGVSRATVREAVSRLKHDGLIYSRQGAGAFVAAPADVSAFRLPTPELSDARELQDIIELLMAVESTATALAAERRSDTQLATIRACLDSMRKAIAQGQSGVDDDVAFHRAIIEASGNPFFRDLSDFLDARVRRFIRTARANTARLADGMIEAVQSEHERIFHAIEARDPVAAKAATEDHLRQAAARLTTYAA